MKFIFDYLFYRTVLQTYRIRWISMFLSSGWLRRFTGERNSVHG